MKFLFLTFAQALSSVVVLGISFLATVMTDGMWLKPGEDSNIIMSQNQTLDVFFKMFGPASRSLPVMVAVGLFLLVVLYVYNIFKIVFGPIVDSENPFKITGKVMLFGTGIYLVKPLVNLALNIATIPFIAIKDGFSITNQFAESAKHGFSISGIIGNGGLETLKNIAVPIVDTVLFSFSDVAMFIFVFMFLAILVEFLKFFIEVITRYVLLGVLTIFAPIALACGPFQKTAQIFEGWYKAFIGQMVLIMFSNFFLKVFTFSWIAFTLGRFVSGIPVLTALAMMFAWLKIGQKTDTYLQNMGAGTLKTGDDLSLALLGAFRFLGGPSANITNALKGGKAGELFKQKNPNFTFDNGKIGKTAPSGTGSWKSAFSMSGHSTSRNFARKIMPTGQGAYGGDDSAMDDKLRGLSSVDVNSNPISKMASNVVPGLGDFNRSSWSMSPESITDALNGKYGFVESIPHPGVDKGIENMFGSEGASKSILSGASIRDAVINPNNGTITGMFNNGIQEGEFKLSSLSNTMSSISDSKNGEIIMDPFGNSWSVSTSGVTSVSSMGASSDISSLGSGSGMDSIISKTEGLGTSDNKVFSSLMNDAYDGRVISMSNLSYEPSEGLDPGTAILSTGVGNFALSDTSVDERGNINPNSDGKLIVGSGDTFTPSGLGADGEIESISFAGLREDSNGVIARVPTSDGDMNFAIVEGLNISSSGGYESAPVQSSEYIRDIAGGNVVPNTTRYSLDSTTGYLDTLSEGGNSIINTSSGPVYTDSFEQSRANAPITDSSLMMDVGTGMFEVDASKTLDGNGVYVSGSPIYDKEGNAHNPSEVDLNFNRGFSVFEYNDSSPYFIGEDRRLYEALDYDPNVGIPMLQAGDRGALEGVNTADEARSISIRALAPDGSECYVSPLKLNNGRVSGVRFNNHYSYDVSSNKYKYTKRR